MEVAWVCGGVIPGGKGVAVARVPVQGAAAGLIALSLPGGDGVELAACVPAPTDIGCSVGSLISLPQAAITNETDIKSPITSRALAVRE